MKPIFTILFPLMILIYSFSFLHPMNIGIPESVRVPPTQVKTTPGVNTATSMSRSTTRTLIPGYQRIIDQATYVPPIRLNQLQHFTCQEGKKDHCTNFHLEGVPTISMQTEIFEEAF